MIRYSLRCEKDHGFEAWFASGAAYDAAAAAHANACPVCGSGKVEKAIMAPAVAGVGRAEPSERMTLASVDPRRAAFRQAVRAFRQKVIENADYVGNRFPEEARKIHYEEAPVRGIYGEATPDEAQALVEEGIGFQPLPPLPDESN